jgi:enolase
VQLQSFSNGKYDYSKFEGETGKVRSSAEQVDYLVNWQLSIISIEDGMDENDWDGGNCLRKNR